MSSDIIIEQECIPVGIPTERSLPYRGGSLSRSGSLCPGVGEVSVQQGPCLGGGGGVCPGGLCLGESLSREVSVQGRRV